MASRAHRGGQRPHQGQVRVRLRRLPPCPPHGHHRMPVPGRRMAPQGNRARSSRTSATLGQQALLKQIEPAGLMFRNLGRHGCVMAFLPAVRVRAPRRSGPAHRGLDRRPAAIRLLGRQGGEPVPARPVRVQPGKSQARPPDSQCVIIRNPGLARLETQPLLNHARQHRWRAQPIAPCACSILISTNNDRNRDVPAQGAVSQTAPATHKTRPDGPGLTCEFRSGRCWVRTNVG